MPRPLLFIHIPKTAGTSFRVALEKSFGSSYVFSDYGLEAPETHDLVRKYFYEKTDSYGLFAHAFEKSGAPSALAGHMHFNRYAPLFPITSIITYVRQPLARLLSEYKHFVRLKGYEGTLSEFMRKDRAINMQARYLRNAPLSALGFIGISEDYDDGLALINTEFELNVPILNLNVAPSIQTDEVSVLDEDIILFNELNEEDVLLYEKINSLYEVRKKLFLAGKPYTYGEYQVDDQGLISGFAYQQKSQSPVALSIELDDNVVAEVEAKELNAQMKKLGSPRKGYVGFHLTLKGSPTTSSDITVRVRETGQCLFDGSAPPPR
ncbi:sulfotransferase family protein [Luminiphilus sp.]|nr:sulfotransferase family protein [Luminiphilus sp.]